MNGVVISDRQVPLKQRTTERKPHNVLLLSWYTQTHALHHLPSIKQFPFLHGYLTQYARMPCPSLLSWSEQISITMLKHQPWRFADNRFVPTAALVQ